MLVGGLVLLPAGVWQAPNERPDAESIASILALSLLGTALAQLVLYRMLRLHGSGEGEPGHVPDTGVRSG